MAGGPVETTPSVLNDDITAKREANLAKQRQDPRRLWFLFWTLAKPYWKYGQGAKTNIFWVVFLGLVRSGLSVVFSFISRDFRNNFV